MVSQLDTAMNLLFPENGRRTGNLKFFRGQSREVTAEQLAEQFVIADEQIRNGKAVRMEDVDGNLAD